MSYTQYLFKKRLEKERFERKAQEAAEKENRILNILTRIEELEEKVKQLMTPPSPMAAAPAYAPEASQKNMLTDKQQADSDLDYEINLFDDKEFF